MSAGIEVEAVSKHFGGVVAVDACSLTVAKGTVTGLIGPNGAGKTTLFNIMAGFLPATSGRVLLDGHDITNVAPHKLFDLGLVRTFQIAQEFSSMSALENLMVPPPRQSGESLLTTWFKPARVRAEEAEVRRRAERVLDMLGIAQVRDEPAGNLSGGQKKLLEIGRTMMVDARIVLLDEPGAGVNRTLLGAIASQIERLNQEHGYTFCIIEHDMDLIARLCDPVIVMTQGKVLTQGTMAEVRANPEVIEAYMGSAAAVRRDDGAAA